MNSPAPLTAPPPVPQLPLKPVPFGLTVVSSNQTWDVINGRGELINVYADLLLHCHHTASTSQTARV